MEIERKWLITSCPEVWPVETVVKHITQHYLVPVDPEITSERIRSSVTGTLVEYTHTKKVRVDSGIHVETEVSIEWPDFVALMVRMDPSMEPIEKVRTVFVWDSQTFELDTFTNPRNGLMILELELPDMNTEVRLPPFIGVSHEVTKDNSYTNAAMAKAARAEQWKQCA